MREEPEWWACFGPIDRWGPGATDAEIGALVRRAFVEMGAEFHFDPHSAYNWCDIGEMLSDLRLTPSGLFTEALAAFFAAACGWMGMR